MVPRQIIDCTIGMMTDNEARLTLELYERKRYDTSAAYIFERNPQERYPYKFLFTGPVEDIVWIAQMLTNQGVDWALLYFEHKGEEAL